MIAGAFTGAGSTDVAETPMLIGSFHTAEYLLGRR